MHVGYSLAFQNPADALGDQEVYDAELALARLAVELGFESLWTVEHHFTEYTMCPDPLQLLTYLAAATPPHVRLGTAVVVLPWHDPLRVAEQVTLLDNLSGGRLLLGIGRGLARVEYEGFRVEMGTSRERFVASAESVLDALETGAMAYDNAFGTQPRRELRPRPQRSFRGRTYAAAVSPESMPIMARLGVGLLIIPQKPWPTVQADFAAYRSVWSEVNPGTEPPLPLCGAFTVVDADPGRAEELAYTYIGNYYRSVLKHYEFASDPHAGVAGYEFYTHITRYVGRHGADTATEDFVRLMPWGTPEQVLEKYAQIRDLVGMTGTMPNFSFGGMPYAQAERSMRLFAAEVLPELRRWEAPDPGWPALPTPALAERAR
jgi:alkanesulfonate monooxygenase SsuD/methylene tetrahydromethanopterin reductase-like flavin-dependent oxidoreductase (luciferase family)